MSKGPTRAALYARVSTDEQKHDLQLDALRQVAEQRGWETTEYVDQASGAGVKLPERNRMMADAQAGKLDVVAVWRFDRLGRSLKDLLEILDCFETWGVNLVSLQESIDTNTTMGRALYSLVGLFAEMERSFIRERIVAGLQAAKKRGKVLGRPRVAVDVTRAIRLHDGSRSWSQVSKVLGVKKSTLHRAVMKAVDRDA